MARTTQAARISALESDVADIKSGIADILALVSAPAKSAPAKGKAKSDADPFPVALAKARTHECTAHKKCGKNGKRLFTQAGATWHVEHNGGKF